jgi:hypothetical protein
MNADAMDAGKSILENLNDQPRRVTNRPTAQDRFNDSRQVRLAGNHMESTPVCRARAKWLKLLLPDITASGKMEELNHFRQT